MLRTLAMTPAEQKFEQYDKYQFHYEAYGMSHTVEIGNFLGQNEFIIYLIMYLWKKSLFFPQEYDKI